MKMAGNICVFGVFFFPGVNDSVKEHQFEQVFVWKLCKRACRQPSFLPEHIRSFEARDGNHDHE